jgi:hypothetical protein
MKISGKKMRNEAEDERKIWKQKGKKRIGGGKNYANVRQ